MTKNTNEHNITKLKVLETISKYVCIASFIPMVYSASCLADHKEVPTVGKVASLCFLGSMITACATKHRFEKLAGQARKEDERSR